MIRESIDGKRNSQQKLYERHAPKMLGVCRNYIKDVQHAEEVMLNGFLKVFTNLKSFTFSGSFEGWIRKIMVREAISFLRKQQNLFFVEEAALEKHTTSPVVASIFETEFIQNLIDMLPVGYRTVFNLYAIEGYKHQEIAALLQIKESTSKSQLFKARKFLQGELTKQNAIDHGRHEI